MSSNGPDPDSSVAAANREACPTVQAMELIGSPWRLIVLYDLLDADEKRFNELKRSTEASSRTLSRVLDDLQTAGLVHRRVRDRPLATFYRLTDRGSALGPVFEHIEDWSETWLDDATAVGEEADSDAAIEA